MNKEKIIFWGLCTLIFFLPFPFGGIYEWSILIFGLTVSILFCIHIFGKTFPSSVETDINPIKLPAFFKWLFFLFIAFSIFQLIPFPKSILKILSSSAYQVYEGLKQSEVALQNGLGSKSISFAPTLSLMEIAKFIFYAVFAYLAFLYIKTKKDIKILLTIIIAVAMFQSLYGLAEYFSGSGSIFGWKNIYNTDSAFGTFINRNHFASFLEMAFPLCIGYFMIKINFLQTAKNILFKEKALWLIQEGLPKMILLALIPISIGFAVFFSKSRMGILSLMISAFFIMILYPLGAKKKRTTGLSKKLEILILYSLIIVMIGMVFLTGINPILERYTAKKSIYKSGRPTYARYTFEMIKDYPLSGTGLGTYVYMYPMYEKVFIPGVVNHAHNDYLEIISESGLIAGGSLILFSFVLLGYLFFKWKKRSNIFSKWIGLGCMAGILAILFHSGWDFPLRIPANAIYFISLYILGFKVVHIKRESL